MSPEDCLAGGGELGELMRALDWSTTPVGPVEHWPQSLRTVVSICLGSRHPLEIWWGPEYVRFYNDGYRPILGSRKHPQFLGRPGQECWPEVWDEVRPMLDQVRETGVAVWHEDYPYFLVRHAELPQEEAFFTFSHGPIRDESGGVAGVLTVCNETTIRVQATRRLQILRSLAGDRGALGTPREACQSILDVLDLHFHDLPFCALYLVDSEGNPVLAAQCGLAETIHWPVRGVQQQQILNDLPGRFGTIPGRPYPDPIRQAVMSPIWGRGDAVPSHPVAVLVSGCNPRCPLDAAYTGFFTAVATQVAAVLGECFLQLEMTQSEQRNAERARRSRERLEGIFAQAPAFMAVLRGPEHVFEMANPRYDQLVGHRELIGKTAREAFPEVEGQGFFELVDEVYRSGQAFRGSMMPVMLQREKLREPEQRFIDLTFAPLFDAQAAVTGVLGHGIDVTEHHQAEEKRNHLLAAAQKARMELEQQRDQLEQANREIAQASQAVRVQQERQAVVLRYLRSANQASAHVTKASTTDDILEGLTRALRNGFYARVCAVYLSADGIRLKRVGSEGALPGSLEMSDPLSRIAGVCRSRKAFWSRAEDVEWKADFGSEWLEEHKIRAAAIVPLTFRERVYGVVAAFFGEDLPDEALAVVAPLCSVVAASLENLSV